MRWNLSVVLIEKELDICTGITRANSAIVYAGYDNKTGTRKAELTVRGNASFDDLCRELEVPFSRCGSLLVTYDKESLAQLRRKWEQGIRNGVPGLELLTGGEAEAMEPMLAPGVAGALYAPTTGTVNPWQLGIAAFENAAANGMEPCWEPLWWESGKPSLAIWWKQIAANCAAGLSSTVQDFPRIGYRSCAFPPTRIF